MIEVKNIFVSVGDKKILDDSNLFSQNRKIVDNYFIQELRLNTNELNNKRRKK